MRKVAIWLLIIFVGMSGYSTAKLYAETHANSDVQKLLYETERSMVAGDRVYDPSMRVHFTMPKTQCFEGKYLFPDGKISDLDCGTEDPAEPIKPHKSVLVKPSKYEECMMRASGHNNAHHRQILMDKCSNTNGMNWDDVAGVLA